MIRVKHLVGGGGGNSRHWNNLADWVCQKRQAGHKRLQLTTGSHVTHMYRIHLTPSSSITSIVVSRRASARSYERRLFRNGKGIRQLFCWLVSGREEEFRLAHAPVLNPLSHLSAAGQVVITYMSARKLLIHRITRPQTKRPIKQSSLSTNVISTLTYTLIVQLFKVKYYFCTEKELLVLSLFSLLCFINALLGF